MVFLVDKRLIYELFILRNCAYFEDLNKSFLSYSYLLHSENMHLINLRISFNECRSVQYSASNALFNLYFYNAHITNENDGKMIKL